MINIQSLNKEFESRVRLGIMSILIIRDWVEFKELKSLLDITDGNLASHAGALEKNGYIQVHKEFVGKKPRTTYQVTALGKKAFTDHLSQLEKLMRQI